MQEEEKMVKNEQERWGISEPPNLTDGTVLCLQEKVPYIDVYMWPHSGDLNHYGGNSRRFDMLRNRRGWTDGTTYG